VIVWRVIRGTINPVGPRTPGAVRREGVRPLDAIVNARKRADTLGLLTQTLGVRDPAAVTGFAGYRMSPVMA
jgi:hypothetical protein